MLCVQDCVSTSVCSGLQAGNVVTGEMVEELILSGADIIKVGIGPGEWLRVSADCLKSTLPLYSTDLHRPEARDEPEAKRQAVNIKSCLDLKQMGFSFQRDFICLNVEQWISWFLVLLNEQTQSASYYLLYTLLIAFNHWRSSVPALGSL